MTYSTGTVRRTSTLAPVLLGAFLILAVAHLGLMLADLEPWSSVTKPLPALTLAAYALVSGRHGLLALGLLLCAGADVALDLDGLFVVGVVLFGLAHIAFILAFVRSVTRPRVPVILIYLLAWAGVMWWLWDGLADQRLQLGVYSLLVTVMAIAASGLNWRTALGGGLFFVSDALIGAGMADVQVVPQQDLWVMATYFGALFFIALGTRGIARSQ